MNKANLSAIPLSVRIGIVGGSNIAETGDLLNSIDTIFSKTIFELIGYKLEPDNTTPVRFSVLSSLSESSDRIITRKAIETLNARLEVVLPFKTEDHVKCLASKKSLNDFESLLKKAHKTKTIYTKTLEEEFSGLDQTESILIAKIKTLRYIIDNSDVIIAFPQSDTSAKEDDIHVLIDYIKHSERTFIIISEGAPCQIKIDRGANLIHRGYRHFFHFNSYKINSEKMTDEFERRKKKYYPPPGSVPLHKEEYAILQEKLLPHFNRATEIADKYKNLYRRTGFLVYLLAPISVIFANLDTMYHDSTFLFFGVEFLLLLYILSSITFADKNRSHKNWIQTRYLAERIRTTIFLTMCGIIPRPIELERHRRVAHHPEEWMVRVYDEILSTLPASKIFFDESDFHILKEHVSKMWLGKQIEFHDKKIIEEGGKNHITEKLGFTAFLIAMLAAAVNCGLAYLKWEAKFDVFSGVIVFLAIVFPSIGTSLGAIRSHREYSRIEKRSLNMKHILEDQLIELKKSKNMTELREVLQETEELILHESQDWLMLLRFAKLETI